MDGQPDRKPFLTYALMFSCIAVYAYEFFVSTTQGSAALDAVFQSFGFSLTNVLAGSWYVPLTSVFLHAGLDHILLNMIALFFFGRALEEHVSRRNFILVFFGSAIAGDIAISAANVLGFMPAAAITIGASAGIFGVMGAAMFVKPLEFVFFPYVLPVPLVLVALLYVIYNMLFNLAHTSVGILSPNNDFN
jgi:rhomboid protease GluP